MIGIAFLFFIVNPRPQLRHELLYQLMYYFKTYPTLTHFKVQLQEDITGSITRRLARIGIFDSFFISNT